MLLKFSGSPSILGIPSQPQSRTLSRLLAIEIQVTNVMKSTASLGCVGLLASRYVVSRAPGRPTDLRSFYEFGAVALRPRELLAALVETAVVSMDASPLMRVTKEGFVGTFKGLILISNDVKPDVSTIDRNSCHFVSKILWNEHGIPAHFLIYFPSSFTGIINHVVLS